MDTTNAESFVILLAQAGSQVAAGSALSCSQPEVSRRLGLARQLLGDDRVLALINQHQRTEACGVTLRKPFLMSTSTCGICGGVKAPQSSGRLRCNACRKAKYRASHPLPVAEVLQSPEIVATEFLILLAKEGSQAAAALALGISQWGVSTRFTKAREVLGDVRAIALLSEHQRDESCGRTLLKSFYINSPICQRCGHLRKPLASTGELVCQHCNNARNRAYKNRHPDRISEAAAVYRAENREDLIQKGRDYRAANPGRDAAYYEANRELIKARTGAYAKANSTQVAARSRHRWLTDESFRDAARARLRAWKKLHPDRVNADTARRQLRLYQAYPAWADDTLISEFYAMARQRTLVTGIPWQVDHIVPLNSDFVCGLHWEGNLQVIPAAANLAKSNAWWPDMPGDVRENFQFNMAPTLYLEPKLLCLE